MPLLTLGSWVFDADAAQLRRNGEIQQLPLRVAQTLTLLAQHPNTVVTRKQLIDEVWQGNEQTGPDGITNAIYRIRKILEEGQPPGSVIATVPKIGYMLCLDAPVDLIDPEKETPLKAKTLSHYTQPFFLTSLAGLVVLLFSYRLFPIFFDAESRAVAPLPMLDAVHTLTTDSGRESMPSISADGAWLAYLQGGGLTQSSLRLLRLKTPQASTLTLSLPTENIASPTWAPDHQRLAFLAYVAAETENGVRCEVRVYDTVRATTSVVSDRCSRLRNPETRQLAWSPDGYRLAFKTLAANDTYERLVWLDLRTRDTVFLNHPRRWQDVIASIAWMPDSQHLLATYVVGNAIDKIALNGKKNTISAAIATPINPFWLPNSEWFLITSIERNNTKTYRVHGQTGKALPLSAAYVIDSPTVATDGQMVLTRGHSDTEITRQVLNSKDEYLPASTTLISSSGRDYAPALSPDEKWLCFVSTRSGESELWLANADGSAQKQLTNMQKSVRDCAWSPDGHNIVFNAGSPQKHVSMRAYIIHFPDDKIQALSETPQYAQYHPTFSYDGKAIYVNLKADIDTGSELPERMAIFDANTLQRIGELPAADIRHDIDDQQAYVFADGRIRRTQAGHADYSDAIVPITHFSTLEDPLNWRYRHGRLSYLRKGITAMELLLVDEHGTTTIFNLSVNIKDGVAGFDWSMATQTVLLAHTRNEIDIVSVPAVNLWQ